MYICTQRDVLNCKCGLFIEAEMCICNFSGCAGELHLFSGIVFDTFLICKVWCLDFFTKQAVVLYFINLKYDFGENFLQDTIFQMLHA